MRWIAHQELNLLDAWLYVFCPQGNLVCFPIQFHHQTLLAAERPLVQGSRVVVDDEIVQIYFRIDFTLAHLKARKWANLRP